ncbi:hypothetical protein HDU97_006543 [Phlyctochytrium planicorne]|nr:hypothetical protein HDU97_006543 [Phlyctochytrium planicorne]
MSVLEPEDNTEYAKLEYWEKRYTAAAVTSSSDSTATSTSADPSTNPDATYEWLKGYDFFKPGMEGLMKPEDRMLHIGIGNSTMADDLYQDGFRFQTCMDFSPTVIATMQQLHPHIKYLVGDMFDLKSLFPATRFTAIIDKATLDAFLTAFNDEDPWKPSEAVREKMHLYLEQIAGCLEDDGTFLHITWSQPHFRRELLKVGGLFDVVDVRKVGTSWQYFVYVCKKTASPSS